MILIELNCKMDCHANPCGLSRNDGIGVDCLVHKWLCNGENKTAFAIPRKTPKSRNGEFL